ncbi:MAG: hypothetical protein WCK39_06830 [Methanomassiliicoccales archaeon]
MISKFTITNASTVNAQWAYIMEGEFTKAILSVDPNGKARSVAITDMDPMAVEDLEEITRMARAYSNPLGSFL